MYSNSFSSMYRDSHGFLLHMCLDSHGKLVSSNWLTSFNELDVNNLYNNYISVNTFNYPDAHSINALECVCLCADIDVGSFEGRKRPLDPLEADMLTDCLLEQCGAFSPTLIEHSGHGLQLFWRVHGLKSDLFSSYQARLFEWLESLLNDLSNENDDICNMVFYHGLHVDKCVSNPNRVMRLPNTLHVKAGYPTVETRIVHADLECTYDKAYLDKLLIFQDLSKERTKKKSKPKQNPNKLKPWTIQYLIGALSDIPKLIDYRNKQGIYEGYRNECMFCYCLMYMNLHQSNLGGLDVLNELERVNAMFSVPLSRAELVATMNTVGAYSVRQISKLEIINKLQINADEMSVLDRLITNTRKQTSRAEQKQSIKLSKAQTKMKVKRLNELGYSISSIERDTGLSRPTIYKYLHEND